MSIYHQVRFVRRVSIFLMITFFFFGEEILNLRATYCKDSKQHRLAALGSEPSSTREHRTNARRCSRSTRACRLALNCVTISKHPPYGSQLVRLSSTCMWKYTNARRKYETVPYTTHHHTFRMRPAVCPGARDQVDAKATIVDSTRMKMSKVGPAGRQVQRGQY